MIAFRLSVLSLAALLGACASAPPAPPVPSAAAPAAEAGAPAEVAKEGLRIDDRRPDAPTAVSVLGQVVELTGSWEYTDEQRKNFDLQDRRIRDRRVREHEVKLEARTRFGADTEAFVEAVGLHETRRTQGTSGSQRSKALERGQAWVKVSRLGGTPWGLQVGRVALIDRRAFWWDDDLDAVRALYSGDDWRLDTGFGREVARISSADDSILPDNKRVARWFGQVTWKLPGRHTLDGFWLFQRDRSGTPAVATVFANTDATDPSDFSGRWLGLRASGEFRPDNGYRFAYWADVAMVRGRESVTALDEDDAGLVTAGASTSRRVRGRALDVGATVSARPLPLRPSLSIGYARGSGGESSGTLDANFRQTGLHENKARLGGVKRLRSYGEVLQPELSNMAVTRLGAGIRILDNSSIELVRHQFRQQVASTTILGSRLSADPLGLSRDVGVEWDLALAFREWRQFELTLKWSRFKPGVAFADDERDPAHAIELGAAFNF
jgi:alginate production protein